MATEPIYNCTQIELYTVAKTGWKSFEDHLPDFTLFKPKYDAPYLLARQGEVTTAETLPDEQSRTANLEVMGVVLDEKGKAGRAMWQKLKRYIEDAYPKNQHKARLEEAGSLLYDKAGNKNWEFLKDLMLRGELFITNHLAELTAGNNMPPAFQGDFTNSKNEYDTAFASFLDEKEMVVIAQQTKISANNLVYEKLIGMMDDGKEIYKNNPNEGIKKQFVFDSVLALIRKPGSETPIPIEGDVLPGQALSITRDFAVEQIFEIENTGTVAMWFYTSDMENAGYQGWGVNVNPGQNQKYTVAELGGLRVFMNVHNQNGSNGSFKVTMVEE